MQPPEILSAPRCVWAAGAKLGEGPLWSARSGALYWVDILGRQLHRYTPTTERRETWDFPEEVSAIAERAQHAELLVTLRSGFALFDPPSNRLERLSNPETDRPGNRFNDGKCDARGRFWAGTMDFECQASTGALYRFDADRRCSLHLDGYNITNGPTWSQDGRTMYFAETGERRIYAFDFDPIAGTPSNRRVWRQLAVDDGLPDGMTTDADGRIWIAHWGAACVTCHDAEGNELARIAFPTRNITSCCFGGADLRTLYVTSAAVDLPAAELAAQPTAGGLFAVQTAVRGLPANLFMG